MLDCVVLEYKICEMFRRSKVIQAKGFWCDGVVLSEDGKHYSKKSVNDNKYVNLKAYIGNDGQTEYSVKLQFGRKALSRYARDLSIYECFDSSFTLDTDKKIIEIQLK